MKIMRFESESKSKKGKEDYMFGKKKEKQRLLLLLEGVTEFETRKMQ
jgi:hypothetical protein